MDVVSLNFDHKDVSKDYGSIVNDYPTIDMSFNTPLSLFLFICVYVNYITYNIVTLHCKYTFTHDNYKLGYEG